MNLIAISPNTFLHSLDSFFKVDHLLTLVTPGAGEDRILLTCPNSLLFLDSTLADDWVLKYFTKFFNRYPLDWLDFQLV